MATWVHKDGESILVGALEVEPHLIAGWSIDKKAKPTPKKKVAATPVPKSADIPTLSKEA